MWGRRIRPSDGGRTRKIGLGIAYPDTGTTYKIGQAWKTGQTPADYSMNLAFQVPHKAVEIGGSQDFHGAVVHGLWEFPEELAPWADLTGFDISVFRSAI